MIEHPISMEKFAYYFDNARIGLLEFPNGECVEMNDPKYGKRPMRDAFPLNVSLYRLFRAITGWELDSIEVPLEEIMGVFATGDACAYPGTTEGFRKKYFGLFGEERPTGKQVPLEPKTADFLVVTRYDLQREDVSFSAIEQENSWANVGDIIEAGIHVVTKPLEEITRQTPELYSGVPIFNDGTRRLEELYGINRHRTVLWDTNQEGILCGGVE